MPKKSSVKKYFEAPDDVELRRIVEKLAQQKSAMKKGKSLKLEPALPTMVKCINAKMSSRTICFVVKELHQIEIKKDTVLRFLKRCSA